MLGGKIAIHSRYWIGSRYLFISAATLQNVPLHLPHTFAAYERLTNSRHLQIAPMGEHGLVCVEPSKHYPSVKESRAESHLCPMPGDFGLVIRSVYISQRMTKARTAPR